jgi:hypothetical protein
MLVPIFFDLFEAIDESPLNRAIFVIREQRQLALQLEVIKRDRHDIVLLTYSPG